MADDEFPFPYVPPTDPNLGRRVDVYFILRVLLGRGGMGAAYLAEHEALPHVKCVIKLVLVEMIHHPTIISRYKTEAEALSLLKHENIVRLHGLGVLEDGQLFLRFEYVEGKSLDKYLVDHGGRLPLRKALNFIFQLCGALQYAHDRGVIHRDLKPENLMVELDYPGSHFKERIKILDFGIAKVVSSKVDATGSGVQMGTPRYMAPEQVTNAASVDGRADVFSLGQVLYKMVTGHLPWGTPENDIMIYHKQRTEAPAWPPEELMPRELAEVVHRTFSLKAADRPTMKEFAIELASSIAKGTEMLAKAVPDWVTSATPSTTTLPRPVAADPDAAPSVSFIAGGTGLGPVPSLNVAMLSPKAPLPEPVKEVTAHERPRALAALGASAVGSASHSLDVVTNAPASLPVIPVLPFVPTAPRRPPTPVLAALPTGLASGQFAAQEPPAESRAPQVEVASEIELATGTPGPLPYAHSDLPAVLVSNTQLSGLTPPASVPAARGPGQPEPAPFVLLPETSDAAPRRARTARSKLAALGGVACAVAAATAFAVARLGSQAPPSDERQSAAIASDAAPVPGAAVAKPAPGAAQDLAAQPAPPEPRIDAKGAKQLAAPMTAPPAPVAASTTTAPQAASAPPAPAVATVGVDAGVDAAHDVTVPHNARPEVPHDPLPAPPSSNRVANAARSSTPAASPSSSAKTAALVPKPSAVATGELVISVDPYAVVWLDNRKIGPTPLSIDVRVGQHRLRLVNEDLAIEKSIPVTITAGKQTRVEETW